MRRRVFTKAEQSRFVSEYELSGQEQQAFAKKRGISVSALQRWRRELDRPRRGSKHGSVRLLPVSVAPGSSDATESAETRPTTGGSGSEVTVEFPNGARLVFAATIPASYVAEVVRCATQAGER